MFGKNTDIYRNWIHKGKEIELANYNNYVVNTGSTMGYNDFDYTYWNCRGFNLGGEPQPLYYDFEKLKNFSSKIKQGAIILICVEEFKLLVDKYEEDATNYKYYFSLNNTSVLNYKKINHILLEKIPCLLQKSLLLQELTDTIKKFKIDNLDSKNEKIKKKDDVYWSEFYKTVWYKEFKWNVENPKLTSEQYKNIEININRLFEMLAYCEKNKWKGIIVIPPFSPNLKRLIPNSILDECLWKPLEIFNESGYQVINFFNDEDFNDEFLYKRALTLNETGKRLFNKKIYGMIGGNNMIQNNKKYTLRNGLTLPWISFGTGIIKRYTRKKSLFFKICILQLLQSIKRGKINRELYANIHIKDILFEAYTEGFRMFDTARIYGHSEDSIGCVVGDYEDAMITTKCSLMDIERKFSPNDVSGNLDISLKNIGRTSVDLYLLHWPEGDWIDTYKQIIYEYHKGRCKAFGICNIDIEDLNKISQNHLEMPMVLQTELHPLNSKLELRKFCNENQIQIMAHTPTARSCSELINNEIMKELSKKYNKTIIQIVLRWHYQNSIIPVVCTYDKQHMRENLNIFDFTISDQDMLKIEEMDEKMVLLDSNGIDDPNYIYNY